MPTPLSLALKPGVDSVSTPFQVGRGLCASNLIRHKNGRIQKRGGSTRLSNSLFMGVARALLGWDDLNSNIYLAVATSLLLEVYSGGNLFDISPVQATSNLTNAFTTTAGSPIVTVADASFSPVVGQPFQIVNLTYIDGLLLQGTYFVFGVGAGTFTFNAGSPAAAGVSGGGAVVAFTTTTSSATVAITLGSYAFFAYQTLLVGISTSVGGLTIAGGYSVAVSAGPVYSIQGPAVASSGATVSENGGNTQIAYEVFLPPESVSSGAFGVGPFGVGAFGIGASSLSPPSIVRWSLGKWGGTLVAAYAGGTIYEWTPPLSTQANAVALNSLGGATGVPSVVNGIFVAAPEQQLLAFGAYSDSLGEQDPLFVAWCDIADYTDWTATATNQAGNFRLSSGSRIVSGIWFGLIGLVWTDADLWSISYLGFPLVYGFNQVAPNCGLIASRAWGILGIRVAWMGQNDFFLFQGGVVETIPCMVRDFVFNNLDRTYLEAIHCDTNTWFDEVLWRFPTIGSQGVCNAYVCFNAQENLWDFGLGSPTISAWSDQSPLGAPVGADYTGLLQQFETSPDFDGQVLNSSFLSGWFQVGDAIASQRVKRILPDFMLSSTGQVQMTFYFSDFLPEENAAYPVRTYGPFPVTENTPYFILRGKGKFWRVLVECISPNTFWRYGEPPAQVAYQGTR